MSLIATSAIAAALIAHGQQASASTASLFSPAVYASSTASSCPGSGAASAALRAQVDLGDDLWVAANAAAGLTGTVVADTAAAAGDPVAANPTTIPVGSFTMDVSLRNVAHSDIPGYGGPAGGTGIGTVAAVNLNGPTIKVSSSRTLQDCAPYPASLYGASAATQAMAWNENAGDGSTLNGAYFAFSTPVRSFGAFFGDIESRPGTPAWFKVFGEGGVLLSEGPIPADETVTDDSVCGGSQETDGLACGNQGTRWLGWVADPSAPITAVLVTVGDDDSCIQVGASQCDGTTEHISWVGAAVGVDATGDPNPTTTTTSTSTSTSTTSTTSTTEPTTTSTSSTTSTTSSTTSTSTTEPTSTSTSTTSTTTTTAPVTTSTTSTTAPTSTTTSTTTTTMPPTTSTTTSTSTTSTTGPLATSTSTTLPTTTTTTAAPTTTTTPGVSTTSTAPGPGSAGIERPAAPPAAAADAGTSRQPLVQTGADIAWLAAIGTALAAAGWALIGLRRRFTS